MVRGSKRGRYAVPTFDATRLLSEDAENAYESFWKKRSVVVEREWMVSDFGQTRYEWAQEFEKRKWVEVTGMSGTCYRTLVKEFMANIIEVVSTENEKRIMSMVRQVPVEVTPETFAEIYELPRVQEPQFTYPDKGCPDIETVCGEVLNPGCRFTSRQLPKSYLKPRYQPLHEFSCSTIIPLKRNTEVSKIRVNLLYAVGNNLSIDLPTYMWCVLRDCHRRVNKQAAIPFGVGLTKLFFKLGVAEGDNMDPVSSMGPITQSSVARTEAHTKKGKALVGTSSGIEEDVEEDEDESASESESGDEEQIEPIEVQGLRSMVHGIDIRLTRLEASHAREMQMLEFLCSKYPDWTPPPPPEE